MQSLDRLAIAQAEAAGISISELWNHYKATKGSTPKPLQEAALELVKAKKAAGRSPEYVRQLEWLTFRFTSAIGSSRWVSDVTLSEVEGYLQKSSASTRKTELARLRTFFRFCHRRGWCQEVVTDRLEAVTQQPINPSILSNEQMGKLLQAVKQQDVQLLEYVWLCGALGVRRAEAFRLKRTALKADLAILEISSEIAKNRSRRLVPIPRALLKKGMVLLHLKWRRNFRKRFTAIHSAAGIKSWSRNVLRHTAATHLGHYLSSEQKVADALGNSPEMIHRHYRGLASPKQSEEYWKVWEEHLAG